MWKWLKWALLGVAILLIGFLIFLLIRQKTTGSSTLGQSISKNCQAPVFTAPPINSKDFTYFVPMGLTTQGHVTPIDHGYFYPTGWPDKTAEVDVHSPTDGKITKIDFEDQSGDPNGKNNFANWVTIEYPCGVNVIYLLMTKLSPTILAKIGPLPAHFEGKIPVSAGEVIGKVAGRSLDFSVTNDNSVLPGFINPKSYEGESWKIHIVDPFKYFDQETKAQILAKDLRQVEPRGGKIDYDIDGKLVGNWFLEDSGGYSGDTSHPDGYWKGHLAIVYDHIDPTFVRISIGDYAGKLPTGPGEGNQNTGPTNPVQFSVKGNAPDPATVSDSSGIVKYELVGFNYIDSKTGQRWDSKDFNANLTLQNKDSQVIGTVLAQVLDGQKIKFEVFPDKTSSQISGFDSDAKIYAR